MATRIGLGGFKSSGRVGAHLMWPGQPLRSKMYEVVSSTENGRGICALQLEKHAVVCPSTLLNAHGASSYSQVAAYAHKGRASARSHQPVVATGPGTTPTFIIFKSTTLHSFFQK